MPSSLVEYPCSRRFFLDERVVRARDGLFRYGGLDPSLTELLDVAVHRYAGRTAVEELGGRAMTYAQLWMSAAHVAGGLKAQGVEIGDRVAIRQPVGVRWVEAFLGAILAGGVPVILDPGFDEEQVGHVLSDSGSAVTLDGELPEGISFIDDGASPEELVLLSYQSGAVGTPKGVELSNENVMSTIESVIHARAFEHGGIRNLLVAPDLHTIGCVVELLATLAVGGTAVIAADPDVASWGGARADVLTAAPATLLRAAERTSMIAFGKNAARWIDYSGAGITADQARCLRETFPTARHFIGWGMNETCGAGLALPAECVLTHTDSVGIAFGGMEVAVFGPDAERGVGELLCRGPGVMRGYWKRPEDTATRFTGGWFHTGDTAYVDGDGFVRIVESHAA